jgi:hypothetical protein
VRWERNKAHLGRWKIQTIFWRTNLLQKCGHKWEDSNKWILRKWCDGMELIHITGNRTQYQNLVTTTINLQVPQESRISCLE